MIRFLIGCFAASLFVCASTASGASLVARAFWLAGNRDIDSRKPLASSAEVGVVLQLKNVGTTPLIISAKPVEPLFKPVFEQQKVIGTAIIYRIGFGAGIGDTKIVPSFVELRTVELRPDEVAEVRFTARINAGVDPATISLEYRVDEDIGERFGIWSGSICTQILQQSIGMPPW